MQPSQSLPRSINRLLSDEPTHLTAGYSYWLKNDYRLDPENGNWPARWAALPLRPVAPHFSGKCSVETG